ncbi:hypothetical protein H6S68_gp22 [Pseudomonas phage Epa7]|uniref:Uncharacterized protein n=1 Tax=Pseudomonas phage Epa7 TaxID=2719200 RepID=A0A6G9LIJ5_9CAUD|nr:hypothetical protein H6S68_gp22 [Pseudomonas phage Epa7]QIQ64506.1 hypothetical protein 7_00022 [Pseudomonas phage Epa7]
MNNKPTLNHHHQTALLYLYNNPSQPPFTGPNNKALNELRQMGYVKAKEFENWAGTGRIRAEWMLTKAGIEFVDNEILRKCAACTGIGQSLLRGKCTVCNGSGQVWISDEPQRHFEDYPQCAPKLEKTDANRLAEQLETIARLEKELEESEKRGSELAASYCDGVEVEIHELKTKLAELEKQEPVAWGAFHFDGKRDGKLYTQCETEAQIEAYILDMHRSSDSLTLRKGPLYTAPVVQAQPSVPDGWKPVPMEPTSQMTFVGQSLRYDSVNSIGEIYRQMLAVAPSPIDPAAHPQPCQQPQAHPARCGCER